MTLAFLVYLVSVVPTIGVVLALFAVLTTLMFAGFFLGSTVSLDVYNHYGDEHREVIKAKSTRKYLRSKIWIPITLILLATLIPSKTTIYTMIAAYAGQKIAETPAAQRMASDGVDVLGKLLEKAKGELEKDEQKGDK